MQSNDFLFGCHDVVAVGSPSQRCAYETLHSTQSTWKALMMEPGILPLFVFMFVRLMKEVGVETTFGEIDKIVQQRESFLIFGVATAAPSARRPHAVRTPWTCTAWSAPRISFVHQNVYLIFERHTP